MNASARNLVALLGAGILVASCVVQESPTGVAGGGAVTIPIQPALVPSPADAGAAPVNRIRARATRLSDEEVLGEVAVDVDPGATEWSLVLPADPGPGGTARARLVVELINAAGSAEDVQFSGVVDSLTITRGDTTTAGDVPIVRGPVGNHYVTGITVDQVPDTIGVDSSSVLGATVSTSGAEPVRVFWTVLDSSFLSVSDSTLTGISAGTGRVVASAGRFADTATVVVRPTVVTPTSLDLEVRKAIDVAQPLEGDSVHFTVTLSNLGPIDATNIVVFDTLPGAFTGAVHAVGAGTLDGDTLWTVPSLAVGDSAVWTTAAVVASGAAGTTATNTARLRSLAQTDSVPANDSASVVTTIPLSAIPVVQITSPPDSTVVDPGDTLTFAATASDPEDGDLTPSISWTSSLDGALATGAGFQTTQLTTGVHQIVASATDQDGGTGADTVLVTVALISTPTSLNVPFGASASLPITLSAPAQAGGLTVSVSSQDEAIARPTTSTVFIPGGALSANAVLEGVVPGTVPVTVSHPQFGAAVTTVSVTADLAILQGSVTVPETFPQPIDIELRSQGSPTAAPAGGLPVTLTSLDPTCAVSAGAVTIGAGLTQVRDSISYGGSAALPCQTWIRATAPTLGPDSVRVTVNAAPTLNMSNRTLGSGLQVGLLSVVLGTAAHGGVTVRIQSQDSSLVRVAPDATTPGTGILDVVVPNGTNRAYYYLQALVDSVGSTVVSATAPGFQNGSSTVDVVTPGIQISALSTSRTALSGEDPFWINTGIPNATQSALSQFQAVSAGADTLDVTVVSDAPGIGILRTATDTAASVSVRILPAAFNSATSVVQGGVALYPAAAGQVGVSASIPGFVSTGGASQSVNITTPGISVPSNTIGSGFQVSAPWVTLGATQHGGTTVTIASADPALALVSPDASTAPTSSIQVFVPNGQNRASYHAHGVPGVTGSTFIRVSAPGFTTDSAAAAVVQGAYEIQALNASTTSFSPDDPFYVRVGIANGQQTAMAQVQQVGNDQPPLSVTVASDASGVVDLVTLPDSAAPVVVQIGPGQSNSATTVAGGGVAAEPITAGTANITARIPGLFALPFADRPVTVTAPGISVPTLPVGAALMQSFTAQLGATNHPGVTVRVQSTDPTRLLVSSDANTAGTAFIDVPLATGLRSVSYWLHGVEGQTGSVPVRVSAPGFVTDSATISVVEPGFDLIGLDVTTTTFAQDDAFYVRVGVPQAGNGSLRYVQPRRAGQAALDIDVTSSATGVGLLTTSGSVQQPVARVQIPEGTANSPTTVAAGGVAFDALGIGTTDIAATVLNPGMVFNPTNVGTRTVDVAAPRITVNNTTVGAGLQSGQLAAVLESSNHGGVTVTLKSSNPGVFLVAPDATTPGTDSIQVVVPDLQNLPRFYVQGVEGATGTATLTVSAPGFTNGVATVTVVAPALDLLSLSSSYSATDSNDDFRVRIGIPSTNDTGLTAVQAIRAGGSSLTATVSSTDPSIAQLVTQAQSGGSVTLTLQPGEFQTPTTFGSGGVALDPVAAGQVTISASIPGVTTTNNGSRQVTINP